MAEVKEKETAKSGGFITATNLREVLATKERELTELNEFRVHSLEKLVKEKEKEAKDLEKRLGKLKEDFKYNLKLLEERDNELSRYDTAHLALKNVLREKDAEIGELKITITDLQSTLKEEQERSTADTEAARQRLADVRSANDIYRQQQQEESRLMREEADSIQRELTNRVSQLEVELDTTQRDMAAKHLEQIRSERLEARMRESELKASLEALTLKYEVAEKSRKDLDEAKSRLVASLEQNQGELRDTSKRLQVAEWEASKRQGVADQRISDLEAELGQCQSLRKAAEAETNKRVAELLAGQHKAEQLMNKQREEYELRLARLSAEKDQNARDAVVRVEQRATELLEATERARADADKARAETKAAVWEYEDRLKDRAREVEDAKRTIEEEKRSGQRAVADVRHELVEKEKEVKRGLARLEDVIRERDTARQDLETAAAAQLASQTAMEELRRGTVRAEMEGTAALERKEREMQLQHEDALRAVNAEREKAEMRLHEAQRQLKDGTDALKTSREETKEAKREGGDLRDRIRQLESDIKLSEQFRDKEREQFKERIHAMELAHREKEMEFDMERIKQLKQEQQAQKQVDMMQKSAQSTAPAQPLVAPPMGMSMMAGSRLGVPAQPMRPEDLGQTAPQWRVPDQSAEIAALRQRLANEQELRDENQRLRLRVSELVEGGTARRPEISRDFEEAASREGRLRGELTEATAAARRANSRAAAAEEALAHARSRCDDLERRTGGIVEELSRAPELAENRIAELQAALSAARRDAELARGEASAHSSEARRLGAQVRQMQTDLLSKTSATSPMATDRDRARRQLADAEAELVRLRSENTTLRSRLHEAARDLRRLMAERERLVVLGGRLRSELDAASGAKLSTSGYEEKDLRDLRKDMEEVVQQNRDLQRQLRKSGHLK